jgi:hypothetical protein
MPAVRQETPIAHAHRNSDAERGGSDRRDKEHGLNSL